jgi:putative peptidoglycan lipid II flippase
MSATPKDTTAAREVVRSAGVMSLAVLASRITGLAREIIMARLFGASQLYDAFLLGFRLPNLSRDMFAEGALSSAFVPTFTRYLETKDRKEAAHLANLVATAIFVVVGLLCLLGVVFAPWLVSLFAPGFAQVPGKAEQAAHLTRIMFPFLLLVALAAQAMGMLNACNLFGVPALSSTMFNIGSVVFGLALGFWAGPLLGTGPIDGMAWGVVLGGALQLAWQLPSLYRRGFVPRPAFDWSHPGLRHIVHLMGPAILGGAAVQINVLVNTNFASYIWDPVRGANGPVSWLGWAFRFMQLPLGLFGVAIASATLPAISRSLAADDLIEFRRTLSRSLGVVFLLTVPSSIGLAVLGKEIISSIYEGGKFDAYDTQQTAVALSFYAIGLAGYAGAKVLNPAFYALRDSRTPMLVSLASIGINYAAASQIVYHTNLGHAGLALSTSVVALFSFVALFILMRRRVGGVYGRDLTSSSVRIVLSSLAMGAVVAIMAIGIESLTGPGRFGAVMALIGCIPAGVVVFYGACRMLRIPELDLARSAMSSPLRRLGVPVD